MSAGYSFEYLQREMNFPKNIQALLHHRLVQVVALGSLLAALTGLSMASMAPVLDADVWWHLKVGDWILQRQQFPTTGIFSGTAATRPWMAYSWIFEVVLSKSYAWYGLLGIGLHGIALTFAVAAVFFAALYYISGRFWTSWLLCGAGSCAFLYNLLPRPVYYSMIYFIVLVALLLKSERSGNVRYLYAVPLVFLLWANSHIQFIYGLIAFALFIGSQLLMPIASRIEFFRDENGRARFDSKVLIGVFVGSVLACCVGPYSYRLFQVVFEYANAKFPYAVLQELQPIDFRHPSDYLLVALGIAGFAFVLRQKEGRLFKLLLLVFATVFAARALRDAWLLGVVGAMILADSTIPDNSNKKTSEARFEWFHYVAAGLVSVVLLLVIARNTGFDTRGLDRAVSSQYPVDASNFMRRNDLPGPLYNDFAWGGFLIWYMPNYPVAIDGRTDLYGDDIDFMTHRSMSGDYAGDAFLQRSRTVLIPKASPLAEALRTDSQFRLVYEDGIATIFIRQ